MDKSKVLIILLIYTIIINKWLYKLNQGCAILKMISAVKEGTRTHTSVTYVNVLVHSLPAGAAFERNITAFPGKAEHKTAQNWTLDLKRSCLSNQWNHSLFWSFRLQI